MKEDVFTNRLIHESSPYSRHAHNPVDWYPWGEEALNKAQKENKLLIISIGYAACHWCHVMEEESFSIDAVADIMNRNFISIKIDREERPDLDQLYMNSVHMMTSRGGWPLNIVALPDGRPIFGGTYFTRDQWMSLLSQMVNIFKEQPGQLLEQAEKITDALKRLNHIQGAEKTTEFHTDDLRSIVSDWIPNIDLQWGGRRGAPKFPMPVGLHFLLDYHVHTEDDEVIQAVKVTLERMALGGIYDQIGGGFARYSVDGYWKVPHFEKMLYDNGQLVSLYSLAYRLMKDDLYKSAVYETLAFVERELMSPEGGFYSALDADSEGEEGKFYVWRAEEIDAVLGDRSHVIKAYYGVRPQGNWEDGKNVLFRQQRDEVFSSQQNMKMKDLEKIVREAKEKLFRSRTKRTPPAVDTKDYRIMEWDHAQGISGCIQDIPDPHFLDIALKNARFIVDQMLSNDNRINRTHTNKKTPVNGFLDDYAFMIDAFIGLYQATFDDVWLTRANELTIYTLKHFFDSERGLFFYESDLDPELIARNTEIADNVIPSSNSVMAHNLFILGHYLITQDYMNTADRMLDLIQPRLKNGEAYYANWSRLSLRGLTPALEVTIVGEACHEKRNELDHHYLPGMLLSGSLGQSTLPLLKDKFQTGKTVLTVCRDKTCQPPVTEVKHVLEQLKGKD